MLEIRKIYMDYERNPEGVAKMPQFGWEIGSDRKNVVQHAYQLQIGEDETFGSLLYDSGMITSDESAHVFAEGVRPEAARRYYVRVRVNDGTEESGWSETGSFVTSLMEEPWKAPFVSGETDDSYKEVSKGTYVRGLFEVKKEIKEAYAYTTALGLYQFYLNGKKVGEDEMTPGWTSYRRHLLYQTYDVTDCLKEGANVAGAKLAAGWYKGVMGLTKSRNNYGDQTGFAMQIVIRYQDGEVETICTDPSWKGCDSPVVFAEIYDGEIYDASLEIPGWAADEVPVGTWKDVQIVPFDVSVLRAQSGARVRVMDELPARRIFTTPKGEQVVDFGQNLAGRIRVTASGKPGDVIELHCFEILDKDGNVYLDNLRKAKATMKYTFAREETVTWHPTFTYMGFQYAMIVSWPGEAKPENFTAYTLHSKMESTGNITCSHPLLNQLHHNYLWGLKGNFLDVPTDCPQRDERLGWTGDAQIFCRTATYLMNTYTFYKKWLRDLEVDQTPEGGVPHVVPNIEEGRTDGNWLLSQGPHSAAAWADAAVINPWTMYLMYGDKAILEKQYESMKGWINFMRAHSEDNIWNYKLQFGDWVALDAEEGSYFGATPNDLTCTAYYAYSTGLFAKMAKALGREEAQEYEQLYDAIVKKFQDTFFDENGIMTAQTQTAHIVALYFRLTPEKYIEKTVEGLKRLLDKENGHLVTGFVGTPYFCHALSQNHCVKEAYDLLLKEDFPSWLYQVKMGATTIWEHWDGIKEDGSMWSADMNSFNHYAYGAIGEWMYRVMAGIEADESAPGFRHSVIYPRIGGGLSYVDGSYHSVYGEIRVKWEAEGSRTVLTVQIPANTTASVRLDEASEVTEAAGLAFVKKECYMEAQAGSGTYRIVFERNV
ncbi:MAG: family 78 glycoside hydrolase catalytic domain [Eubacteriales bacterium]|nr:family 78 glycoside hydrolase catalytic domain [Eubacteriales bacterium]